MADVVGETLWVRVGLAGRYGLREDLACYDCAMIRHQRTSLWFYGKRVILILMTLLFCVGCDQKTKSIARENLRDVKAKSFFHDTLRLEYAENSGAFLGLGDSLPASWRTAIFSFGCSIAVAAATLYTLFAVDLRIFQLFALSLLVAGGVGNIGAHVSEVSL